MLGLILFFAVRAGAFRRPGLTIGLFLAFYGLARIFCEFFRQPDPQLGFLFGGATMGMFLSMPLVLIGGVLIAYALAGISRRSKFRPGRRDNDRHAGRLVEGCLSWG